MAEHPFILSFDSPIYYGHDSFPNHMYRRQHPRHHIPLDMHTLGLMARLAAHGHHIQRNGDDLTPIPKNNKKDIFEVHLDVGLFQPEDLSVKVINDSIIIEGKHDERADDHGHISRHFSRRYSLPKGYEPEKIVSTLTADGVLTIRVPKPIQLVNSMEFVVPIKQLKNDKNENEDQK